MSVTPFSGISYFVDGLLPLVAWLIVLARRRQTPGNHQLDIWAGFFGPFALFLMIMAAPHLALYSSRPDLFPTLMTWGYIGGHVFLYLALASLVRLDASLIERLYGRERLLFWLWAAAGLAITAVNIILPNHPLLERGGITNLGASAPMGVLIPIFTLATVLPLVILFFRSAWRKSQVSGQRRRSILLGSGLLLVMLAGPIHDFAKTPPVLFTSDVLTALAQLVILLGVLFKPRAPTPPKPSTTTDVA